jgi:hypothetical protein
LITTDQVRALESACAQYPRACWVVALHHHVVEYPRPAKLLSIRIGTALVNGNWFVRRLKPLAHRIVLMHGHRHIDWIGECGGMPIISAPSPVMEATDEMQTYFYIHSFAVGEPARFDARQLRAHWVYSHPFVQGGIPRSLPSTVRTPEFV